MLNDRTIFIEKMTEFLPRHMLSPQNHTVRSFCTRCETVREFENYCENENYNFLGITTPPYNPYGAEFNYAVVFEDKDNDYEILWHHCGKRWLNKLLTELGYENL